MDVFEFRVATFARFFELVESHNAPHKTSGKFDWDAAKARLAWVAKTLEEVHQLSPERAKQVLDERARKLAQVPPEEPESDEVLEAVTFSLAGERFAVETRYVLEVLRSFDCTVIPGAPEFLSGVTNRRGEVLAVMDLCGFFNLKGNATGDQRPWVIVLGVDRAEFGILAHAVNEVTLLRVDQIHPPPGSVAGIARDYLRGVTSDALIVLDGGVLLADERLVIDQSE